MERHSVIPPPCPDENLRTDAVGVHRSCKKYYLGFLCEWVIAFGLSVLFDDFSVAPTPNSYHVSILKRAPPPLHREPKEKHFSSQIHLFKCYLCELLYQLSSLPSRPNKIPGKRTGKICYMRLIVVSRRKEMDDYKK